MESAAIELPEWLLTLLNRQDVGDVLINGPGSVFIESLSTLQAFKDHPHFNDETARKWALSLIASNGKSFDAKRPFFDGVWSGTHRFHLVFPPIVQNMTFSFRRIPRETKQSLWENDPQFSLVLSAVLKKESVLICGGTGSGKTTLLNELLSHIGPTERVLILEDTPELNPQHPHVVHMQVRPANAEGFGEIELKTLLRQTLRMRPDRIVIGECRGGEILSLLEALNLGHRGALCTVHANSARDAIQRLEWMARIGSEGILDRSTLREWIASALQRIVYLDVHQGTRYIREHSEICGREGDTILMRAVVKLSQ